MELEYCWMLSTSSKNLTKTRLKFGQGISGKNEERKIWVDNVVNDTSEKEYLPCRKEGHKLGGNPLLLNAHPHFPHPRHWHSSLARRKCAKSVPAHIVWEAPCFAWCFIFFSNGKGLLLLAQSLGWKAKAGQWCGLGGVINHVKNNWTRGRAQWANAFFQRRYWSGNTNKIKIIWKNLKKI